MVDTGDLKSPGSNTVRVRVPLRAIYCEEATHLRALRAGLESKVGNADRDRRPGSMAGSASERGSRSEHFGGELLRCIRLPVHSTGVALRLALPFPKCSEFPRAI